MKDVMPTSPMDINVKSWKYEEIKFNHKEDNNTSWQSWVHSRNWQMNTRILVNIIYTQRLKVEKSNDHGSKWRKVVHKTKYIRQVYCGNVNSNCHIVLQLYKTSVEETG
jgi:hypothetical protein